MDFVRLITADPKLEEVKIVEIMEAYSWGFVPQNRGSRKETN